VKRLALIAFATLAVSACGSSLNAPTDARVCWHLVQLKDGSFRFNKLADDQPNLETCAATLEAMRIRFNRLGSSQEEVNGAYQGQFIFIDPRGVFTANSITSTRYPALVRTGDGRLAIPGAIRQQ
jgi:hypothetical protein